MNYNINKKIKSGVYVITNSIDSRIYIGSSKDLKKRYCYHKSDLIKKKHINRHLQYFVNKYGIETLDFILLDECSVEELFIVEQIYLDALEPFGKNGFNLFKKAVGGFTKHTKKSKKIMSLKRKGVKLGKFSEERLKIHIDSIKNSKACQKHLRYLHKKVLVKTYYFINPTGEKVKIKNLKQFCIKNNLKNTKMVSVYKGRSVSHKGWRKYRGRKRKTPPHFKTIFKHKINGSFIAKFSSLLKAAKSINSTNVKYIRMAATSGKQYKGFLWGFKRLKQIH